MNQKISSINLLIILIGTAVCAVEYFAVPVPDGGNVISPDRTATVTISYDNLTLQEVIRFYKKRLQNEGDIKWRDTDQSGTVILYDWGSREWHKIAIRRCDSGPCTLVTIRKDSWTWIIGTLIIRFVGVFVVLVVIMIMLIVSGRIFSSADTKKGKEKPQPVVAK